MIEGGCPLCKVSDSEAVIHEDGFTGRQCATCGVIFVSPRPSRPEMDALYESGHAHLSPDFFVVTSDSPSHRMEARHAIKRLRRHVQPGSLLEIGPGSGAFLLEARQAGFDVYGVELNPTQAEFIRARRGIPCATSLEAVRDLGPGVFDIVYHRDVLSHFYDPVEEFRRIRELLPVGGHHVFHTGNFGDVDHRHFARVKSFQYPDHLFFYSERGLRDLLGRTGFEHVCTYRYSTLPEGMLQWQLRRLLGRDHERATSAESPAQRPADPGSRITGAGRIARDVLDLVYYSVRHTLGAIVIRQHDPQTLTVVARKTA